MSKMDQFAYPKESKPVIEAVTWTTDVFVRQNVHFHVGYAVQLQTETLLSATKQQINRDLFFSLFAMKRV